MVFKTIGRVMDFVVKAIFIMIPTAVVIIATLTLFEPVLSPPFKRAQSAAELRATLDELPEAEARWNAHPVLNYNAEVRLAIHPTCFAFPQVIQVRNGHYVRPAAVEGEFNTLATEPCSPIDWLPGSGFETLRESLSSVDTEDSLLIVEFDAQYGFVSKYQLQGIGHSGLFVFTVIDFQPVDP